MQNMTVKEPRSVLLLHYTSPYLVILYVILRLNVCDNNDNV